LSATLQPVPRRPEARFLALSAAFVLSLGGCADDPGTPWWRIGFGHAAAAAAEDGDTGNAAGSYLAGRAAMEAGDLKGAADDLEQALAAAPDDVDLRRQVFELLLASGELDRAVTAARALDENGAATDMAVLVLALDAVRTDRADTAVALFERLGVANIAGPVQPMLLAWARFAAGGRAAAIAELADADPETGLERLRAFYRATMLGLDERPREGLDALAPAFPDLLEAPSRVQRGALALQLAAGDRAAADQLVARLREAAPDDPEIERLATAVAADAADLAVVRDPATGMGDALISIGEAFFDQERNVEALALARAATLVAPKDPDTWLLIARVGLAQENPAEALRALDQVPDDGPVGWTVGLMRARALQDQERLDEAVVLLERMSQEQPSQIDALVAMGDLLRGEDRFAEAEAAYTRAIARVPSVDQRHWRLFYARGIAFERTKRWPQAEADLLEALELEPEQPFVLNYLGYSWVDQGLNLDRAKGMLNRAVELRPEDGFIVDSLGWAYFRLGEHDKAVTYLERAVELEPGDPVINDHLGDAYWRVGRQREARFQWQRALTFEPEPDAVTAIQGKLANGLSDAQPAPG
jgi:tetratricopeptide (TPR) repeat protein